MASGSCSKEIQSPKNDISEFIPDGFEKQSLQVVDAINYGLTNAISISRNKKEVIIDYNLAERIALGRLGFNTQEFNKKSLGSQEYLTEEEVDKTLSAMSETMMEYNEKISNLFSIFESEEKEEEWNIDEVEKQLLLDIAEIEFSIVGNQQLADWEKTTLLMSTTTAKSFVVSLESLAKNIDNATYSKWSFKKIWKGITKVARAVVNTVVSVVVNVSAFTMGGYFNGWGNTITDGGGFAEGSVRSFGCAVAGAVTGFFGGIKRGLECDFFDFNCMLPIKKTPCYREFKI